jgi:IS605 OrfB family transposase
MIKTLSVRVRDKHAKVLNQMAFEANQVWNAVNAFTADFSYVPVPEVGYISNSFTAYDLQKRFKHCLIERGFNNTHSTTIQEVIAEHAKARKQFKKSKLRWRVSSGSKRSLGWIPFKSKAAKWKNGQVYFNGHYFKVWDSYGLDQFKFRAGNFAQDARGRWYFNITVEVKEKKKLHPDATKSIGIDLGLKDIATCSDGKKLEAGRFYQNLEKKLAVAQRANNKRQIKTIHAKIKNRRKDAIHKFTTRLVKDHAVIFIGNVASKKLAKTKMAKSVLDSGWFVLKEQVRYKAMMHGVWSETEINEAYTTQMCSCCGEITDNSPKGRAGLGIREWFCAGCGTTHDRDVNAAKNILRLGLESLAGESPGFIRGE